MFCMRVMVGVIILYDHVHPVGAFSKASKIDVRIMNGKVLRSPAKASWGVLKEALQFMLSSSLAV